jgi:hypothetical protein
MTAFITPCWRSLLSAGLAGVWLLFAPLVFAAGIEPQQAQLVATEDGYALSAEFKVDLGPRLEEVVMRGVPLTFSLEFDLTRPRWYWISEHIAARRIDYRLSYNALTRQYRISVGALHQSFFSLTDALRVISRIVALPVVGRGALRNGETYNAALRLTLDRSQLPKPLQVDALANRDWQIDAKVQRWTFVPTEAR